MSVLIFAEATKGQYKKNAFEAVYYGSQLAKQLGTEAVVFTIGNGSNAAVLGQYGANKIWNQDSSKATDSQVASALIAQAAEKAEANYVILSNSALGKSLTGRLGVKLNAGVVSGVTSLPDTSGTPCVNKQVFSGKGIACYELKSGKNILSVMGNSLKPEVVGSDVAPENTSFTEPSTGLEIIETKTVDGTVPLPEAELVVSAGRGMKAPENWGIIEELADVLGATTACSRPVADTGWRPHHEHVGQTGVAIRPNLYIAIGISGAIQHLAGVNNSKTIVVINKDPEAPFFKAADYGIVADLFDVVPKLTESLKKFKQ